MHKAQDYYPKCPEPMIVSLARSGDRSAFEELVRRRQSSVRNLMRSCCGDITLADDLAQQVFIKIWQKIHTLKKASALGAWIKRVAVSVWLQYLRKNDALRGADELTEVDHAQHESTGLDMDLDHALSTLPSTVRLCIVLSYQEGMTHKEISELLDTPLGTVKSHIGRGTQKLQKILEHYSETTAERTS